MSGWARNQFTTDSVRLRCASQVSQYAAGGPFRLWRICILLRQRVLERAADIRVIAAVFSGTVEFVHAVAQPSRFSHVLRGFGVTECANAGAGNGPEAVSYRLATIPGFGTWTAGY